MKKLKILFTSKLFRLLFSALLIFIAFRKIDVVTLFKEVTQVPPWIVLLLLVYMAFSLALGGLRWSVLVLGKVTLSDVLTYTKATYAGSFYALFFPSSIGGDLLKWTSLTKKYPEISKFKLAGSALIDRVVGFSSFSVSALISLVIGKILKYQFPEMLLWFFLGINFALLIFYLLVFSLDFGKILERLRKLKIFKNETLSKMLGKVFEVADLLKSSNKKVILACFFISLLSQPIWMMMTWFCSLIFGVGINLLQVYIFMPIISLILVLPISWAGFGARENLFLLFFGQLGFATDKLLLVSTFGGLIGILNALIGGLVLLF